MAIYRLGIADTGRELKLVNLAEKAHETQKWLLRSNKEEGIKIGIKRGIMQGREQGIE